MSQPMSPSLPIPSAFAVPPLYSLQRADAALDLWPRLAQPALLPLLRHYTREPGGSLLALTFIDGAERLSADLLPTAPKRLKPLGRALLRDMERLVRLYRQHATRSRIRLRLEIERHDRCRYFHTDRIGLRLISTYLGPGTEWAPERSVDRAALGSGDNRAIVLDPGGIAQLQPFWVGLFKGDLHPACPGLGCVHRSPPIAHRRGAIRILLTIDDPSED
jgi:hypothetical protein